MRFFTRMLKALAKLLFYVITGIILVISFYFTLQELENLVLLIFILAAMLVNVYGNTFKESLGADAKNFIVTILLILATIFIFLPKQMSTCATESISAACQTCKCVGISGVDLEPYCLGQLYDCQ